MIFVPGGFGVFQVLGDNPVIGKMLAKAHRQQGKIVGAVFFGVSALLGARAEDGSWAFAGKQMTGFPNTEMVDFGVAEGAPWLPEERLTQAGAKYIPGHKHKDVVVVDGNLILRAERGIRKANRARHHQSGQCGCAQVKMQSARPAIGGFIVAYRKFSGPGPEDPGPFSFASEQRVHRILADAGFQSVTLEPRDFDLDIACGGGIEEALEAAMALGPTSRALQDQGPETRAAVATSIRRALQPYQRGKQVALAGAIWLVTANNA